jgi:N-acetylmuramoyl-L-alanine amidase
MNFRIFDRIRTGFTGAVLALGLGLALSTAQPAAAKPLELRDLAIAGDSLKTRMLFSLDVEAEPKLMLLRSPHRLVIDLPEARFRFDEKALKPRGLITGIKYGPIGEGMSRIVVSAKGPFKIVDFNMLANEEKAGNRLVLDLEAASEQLFDAALAEQATSTGSTNSPKGG